VRRREFLRASVASLAAARAVMGCAEAGPRRVEDGREWFPQGIASGDPRPDGVVLWARVVDPDLEHEDIELEVDVSTDESFERDVATFEVIAEQRFDHCAKLRVTDLEPGTTYFYRFVHHRGGEDLASRTGRTRTAPAADADVPVRFAFVSCQDFVGRWYAAYLALAEEELDFVVHLGDYVYETTGDPAFQDPSGARAVEFSRPDQAIPFEDGAWFAARSLSNYRDLYRIYRSDPALQRVHERFAMIAIWDDHEFSNDCHGATATYTGGRENETDPERRRNADQAWFEWMPFDPAQPYDPQVPWPDDLSIHRELRFGRHLHLFMTDARSFRTDHPIPEDAFPGTVAIDEPTLVEVLGEVPPDARAYVDIDAIDGGSYRDALKAAAPDQGLDPSAVTGLLSVAFVNTMLDASGSALAPLDPDGRPRGLAFVDMGKNAQYGALGSRNLVIKTAYDAFTKVRWIQSDGESEQVLGGPQEDWLVEGVTGSDATWKIWGNEYALSQIAVDLSAFAIPEEFRKLWYLTVDLWDGHRNRRNRVLDRLAGAENVVAITGDIHGFHAGIPMTDEDPERRIVELVTSSISSATFTEELDAVVASSPELAEFPSASQLVEIVDALLTSPDLRTNPHLGFSDSTRHGYVVVTVDGERLAATFRRLSPMWVRADPGTDPDAVIAALEDVEFRVEAGRADLWRRIDGDWRRWDPATFAWE
jgi:alkaline phosphatase D